MSIRFEHVRGPVCIQDAGRSGAEHLGIPPAGFADTGAAQAGNLLVGNMPHAPILEISLSAPRITFLKDCPVAWTGADMGVRLDVDPIEPWQRLHASAGSVLDGAAANVGVRGYLAIGGHWQVGDYLWRNSVSPPGQADLQTQSSWMRRGEVLTIDAKTLPRVKVYTQPTGRFDNSWESSRTIIVQPGPDLKLLSQSSKVFDGSQGAWCTVGANSNRMGIRLRPQRLIKPPKQVSLPSNPVLPGTVQLLPDGQLIITHVDGGTMGGYPRVGLVDRLGLDILAQLAARETARLLWER